MFGCLEQGALLKGRSLAGLAMLALFAAALLSAAPQLHERLHPDAGTPQHVCVVTLIGTGHCAVSVVGPIAAAAFAKSSGNLVPLAQAKAVIHFRRSSVLEHAPPFVA